MCLTGLRKITTMYILGVFMSVLLLGFNGTDFQSFAAAPKNDKPALPEGGSHGQILSDKDAKAAGLKFEEATKGDGKGGDVTATFAANAIKANNTSTRKLPGKGNGVNTLINDKAALPEGGSHGKILSDKDAKTAGLKFEEATKGNGKGGDVTATSAANAIKANNTSTRKLSGMGNGVNTLINDKPALPEGGSHEEILSDKDAKAAGLKFEEATKGDGKGGDASVTSESSSSQSIVSTPSLINKPSNTTTDATIVLPESNATSGATMALPEPNTTVQQPDLTSVTTADPEKKSFLELLKNIFSNPSKALELAKAFFAY